MVNPEDLVVRAVYLLRSRNLRIGVWDGRGFIGIREKFGDRFLFTEYPNTAVAYEQLDVELDPRIRLRTHYESSTCYWCGWPVSFDKGLGWSHDLDGDCDEVRPMGRTYSPLFQALDELEHPDGSAFRN